MKVPPTTANGCSFRLARLGKDAFLALLRDLACRCAFGILKTADLRHELEERTGRSWEDFFRSWVYGAGLSDANLHLYTDLSLLLVAGGVGGIKGGQHVRYPNRTPMANLLLTMLDKADVPRVEKLGDSTGRLDLPTT